MGLSLDQIRSMAPDPRTLSRGERLAANPGGFSAMGCTSTALWCQIQGSRPYTVMVDTNPLGFRCSCPVRRPPCKHILGALLLYDADPQRFVTAEPPETVAKWLTRRTQRATAPAPAKPVDADAQAKRVAKREQLVAAGLDQLELWMCDLARAGLGRLQDGSAFQAQAARLVDAQAKGLAGRVRGLGELVGSGPDWPQALADGLGRLALLVQAYRNQDALDPPTRAMVRRRVGWVQRTAQVLEQGERVAGAWAVAGQRHLLTDQGIARSTWLLGDTGRIAVLEDFAPSVRPQFDTLWRGGHRLQATLVFYPGAGSRRALVAALGDPGGPADPPQGAGTWAQVLDQRAQALALDPWAWGHPFVLQSARAFPEGGRVWVQDLTGATLPGTDRPWFDAVAWTAHGPATVFGVLIGGRVRLHGVWTPAGWRPVGPR